MVALTRNALRLLAGIRAPTNARNTCNSSVRAWGASAAELNWRNGARNWFRTKPCATSCSKQPSRSTEALKVTACARWGATVAGSCGSQGAQRARVTARLLRPPSGPSGPKRQAQRNQCSSCAFLLLMDGGPGWQQITWKPGKHGSSVAAPASPTSIP
jgi:hypothetical protein